MKEPPLITFSYLSPGYYAGLVASSMFIGRVATWFVEFFVQIPLIAFIKVTISQKQTNIFKCQTLLKRFGFFKLCI